MQIKLFSQNLPRSLKMFFFNQNICAVKLTINFQGWDSPSSAITVFSSSKVFHWKNASQVLEILIRLVKTVNIFKRVKKLKKIVSISKSLKINCFNFKIVHCLRESKQNLLAKFWGYLQSKLLSRGIKILKVSREWVSRWMGGF